MHREHLLSLSLALPFFIRHPSTFSRGVTSATRERTRSRLSTSCDVTPGTRFETESRTIIREEFASDSVRVAHRKNVSWSIVYPAMLTIKKTKRRYLQKGVKRTVYMCYMYVLCVARNARSSSTFLFFSLFFSFFFFTKCTLSLLSQTWLRKSEVAEKQRGNKCEVITCRETTGCQRMSNIDLYTFTRLDLANFLPVHVG